MRMIKWITFGAIGVLALACAAMRPHVVTSNDAQSSPEEPQNTTTKAESADNQVEQKLREEAQLQNAENVFAQSSVNDTETLENQADAFATYSSSLGGFAHGEQGASRSLVIRSSEEDAKEKSGIEEDLAVMSHILDKALDEKLGGRAHGRKAMGIDVWFASSSNPFRSMYLDGYGALFMLKVGFPLLPAPKSETSKEKRETSSTWEEARQELYGHPGSAKTTTFPSEEYDEEKVNTLKDTLFEALKNASNIHDLKPDDSVTLCIFGSAGKVNKGSSIVKRGTGAGEAQNRLWVLNGGASTQARGTIMTIRVRKADVDDFAKGKLNSDDFRNRAKVASYLGNVEGGAGVMSFGGGGGMGSGNYQIWQTR